MGHLRVAFQGDYKVEGYPCSAASKPQQLGGMEWEADGSVQLHCTHLRAQCTVLS